MPSPARHRGISPPSLAMAGYKLLGDDEAPKLEHVKDAAFVVIYAVGGNVSQAKGARFPATAVTAEFAVVLMFFRRRLYL